MFLGNGFLFLENMDKWFEIDLNSALGIILSALGIYVSVIILTRIFGKRSFSKMSSFDFAMTVAVGSLLATTILSSTVSLLEGMLGLLMVYVLQLSAAVLRRYKYFNKAIDNRPLLLMDGPHILRENLKKARVTEGDLRSKLREANVHQLSQINAVVFETTGDIVVLHAENLEVEEWIMQDVVRE